MFKSFYVHYNRGCVKLHHAEKRGFTAFIEGCADDPRKCNIQITYCSVNDAFCKKEGRSHAHESRVESINKRQLSNTLDAAATRCHNSTPLRGWFDYTLKYVV